MTESERLLELGLSCEHAGDKSSAEDAYRRAAEASPEWSVPFYNLGLLCKYQGRWPECLEFNRKATGLAPHDEASWWNLGIAATAMENWDEARRAWRACGMKSPPGNGPPDFSFGMTPIRLDPNHDAEVVWADRMDPARARILSIPLPWSTYNFGDTVLMDGAPDGYRAVNGRQYPVFNVLAVIARSPLKKYIVELATSSSAAIAALRDSAESLGGAAENWGQSTNILCAACSRGTPHEHPTGGSSPAHPHCGLAARDDTHVEKILRAWLDRDPSADLIRWFDASSHVARDGAE